MIGASASNDVNMAAPASNRTYTVERGAAATESVASGVSWGAVLAGAAVAAAMGLALTVLGVGLGLSSISPWSGSGASANTVTAAAVMWLVVSQAISAGLGGYVAGRLRIKWAAVHTDEVFFRDTAHGFLVWALGVSVGAAFLASAATSIVATAGKATAAVGTAAAGSVAAAAPAIGSMTGGSATQTQANNGNGMTGGGAAMPSAYLTDSLFRSDRPAANDAQAPRAEVGRILVEAVRTGNLPPADRTYAAQVVAAQTGLSQADAEARVDAAYNKAKSAASEAEQTARKAADDARRAAAKTAIWTFIALLVGAFCACVAATLGGSQRDRAAHTIA